MVNEALHARLQALVAEDRLEEALALADELESLPIDEFDRKLESAPPDDEPFTSADSIAVESVIRGLASSGSRLAG